MRSDSTNLNTESGFVTLTSQYLFICKTEIWLPDTFAGASSYGSLGYCRLSKEGQTLSSFRTTLLMLKSNIFSRFSSHCPSGTRFFRKYKQSVPTARWGWFEPSQARFMREPTERSKILLNEWSGGSSSVGRFIP